MSINSYQGNLELGACFCIFELSTGSSSELALCSPSISQGIMPDLTQVGFPMVEDGPFGTRHSSTDQALGCTSIEETYMLKPDNTFFLYDIPFISPEVFNDNINLL
ncbi:hypothetical protein NQ317_009292 [Molorchus minor]|uniref:Uncharacterized protein n=1 Tax=Molorchus minor TaxID=1323400 RepID=A0ABQ9IQT4_9CUCU|nr:hypothetical protein NQ317_009292 [Molorchus minor]